MYIENGPLMMASMVHPLEYENELACQKNGVYNWLMNFIAGIKLETSDLSEFLLDSYLVTENTSPRLFRIYQLALKRLSCDEKIPLFIKLDYGLTAEVHGSDATGSMIIINSACLSELTDSELLALLGQQIGRIKAGHVKNIEFLNFMQSGLDSLPVIGSVLGRKIYSYFSKWITASKYTADRAAVIACGSISTVINLLKKQTGADYPEIINKDIGNSEISKPEKLGLYYIWLYQSIPAFGVVERIRELRYWAYSQEFRERFPYIFYTTRLYFEDKSLNAVDEEVLLLHKRAENGNYIAAGILGEAYLFKKKSLPHEPYAAVSLLMEAAYHGEGRPMYLLYLCAESNLLNYKKDETVAEQLLRASASRFDDAKKVADKLPKLSVMKGLESAIRTVYIRNLKKITYVINESCIGEPIEDKKVSLVRNSFWMKADEIVYAYEIFEIEDSVFGLAITETGIYGRLQNEPLAFFIPWTDFATGNTVMRHDWDANYFFYKNKKFYKCADSIKGTIGEAVAYIKTKLEK